jgi:hypothetical protein
MPLKLKRRYMEIAFCIAVSAVLAACYLLLAHSRRVRTVEFVLPDGFRGGFAIEVDEENGDEVATKNGNYVIPIGEDGLARIDRFVFSAYLPRARFRSGGELWVETRLGDVPQPDSVCLFGGSTLLETFYDDENRVTRRQARYWWFAGTPNEYEGWKGSHKFGSVREK